MKTILAILATTAALTACGADQVDRTRGENAAYPKEQTTTTTVTPAVPADTTATTQSSTTSTVTEGEVKGR